MKTDELELCGACTVEVHALPVSWKAFQAPYNKSEFVLHVFVEGDHVAHCQVSPPWQMTNTQLDQFFGHMAGCIALTVIGNRGELNYSLRREVMT